MVVFRVDTVVRPDSPPPPSSFNISSNLYYRLMDSVEKNSKFTPWTCDASILFKIGLSARLSPCHGFVDSLIWNPDLSPGCGSCDKLQFCGNTTGHRSYAVVCTWHRTDTESYAGNWLMAKLNMRLMNLTHQKNGYCTEGDQCVRFMWVTENLLRSCPLPGANPLFSVYWYA